MDATGEEKEGDIDELLLKGHFVVEAAEEAEEEAAADEAAEAAAEAAVQQQEDAVDELERRQDAALLEEVLAKRAGAAAEGAAPAEREQKDAAPSDAPASEPETSDDDDSESSDGASSVASIEAEAAAPLEVGRRRTACAAEFRVEGFTIAAGALTAAEVAQTRAACDAYRATARDAHRLELAPERLDLLMPAFADAELFRFLHARAPWMGAARALLGDDCDLFTYLRWDSNSGLPQMAPL